MHRLQELVRLHRMGLGSRQAAQEMRMGRNTHRAYRNALSQTGLLDGTPDHIPELSELKAAILSVLPPRISVQQTSSAESWRLQVKDLAQKGLGPQAIYDRLRLEHKDFSCSLASIKRLQRRLQQECGVRAEEVAIPVETRPGEVAQVDFGYAGKLWDPVERICRKAWVFVMVHGHSRHQYAEVVFDQRLITWIALHERAFERFGGVPKVIVPDNLKSAVVRAAFGVDERSELNRTYREAARHYGFRVDPTPPRAPQKKGKVEAGVKYVKHNFLRGRSEQDIREVNRELSRWTMEIAGQRIHGTTHRRPLEVFELEERKALLALPQKRYEIVVWKKATVHMDSHVQLERRLYSVPWRLVGHKVWIRSTPTTIAIYADDERVATHSRSSEGVRSTVESHLPAQRACLRHRSRDYWENKADQMGSEVGQLVRDVFDSDDVLLQLRPVQAIVSYLENFPVERAQAACRRASFFGNYTLRAIKNILNHALDFAPLPSEQAAKNWAKPPQFARNLDNFAQEERHGRH